MSSVLLLLLAGAAQAASDPLAPLPQPAVQAAPAPAYAPAPVPVVLTPPPVQAPVPVVVQAPKDWRGVFDAIRRGEWDVARAGIVALPPSPLTAVARAELYTAKGSPTVGLDRLQSLLAEAPDLPHAEQLAALAVTRGATEPLAFYPRRRLLGLGEAPGRTRARPVAGEPIADALRIALDPLIKDNDAVGAEALLLQSAPFISVPARAEAAQRVAWAYYINRQDAEARRVADTWRNGATGEWVAHAAWVSGMASWRLNDCEAASRAFREVAGTAFQRELGAGGYYWAARAEQACRRPRAVEPLLRAAAASPESFYGLLARETLGTETRLGPDPHVHAPRVEHLPNVRRAVELVAHGERAMAEELLRHQAKIGNPQDHHGLIEFAKRLDLAGAQFWLAHNGQRGAIADPQDRYPTPRWSPLTGWRIDPALAFGHVIQESTFRAEAVSPVGAVGLMQVRPGTAEDMARARGINYNRNALTDPSYNLEFGQSFIERMRGNVATGGQLPRIIAAYNAGPLPVARWAGIYDKGDPLLWIESIPYWETRFYVPAVLRNMWVYEGLAGTDTPTLRAMAQHRWPAFPTRRTNLAER